MKTSCKTIFLYLCCCLFVWTARAANGERFSFDPTLSFNHTCHYNHVTVVDYRLDTSMLAPVGRTNFPITMKQPFSIALAAFGEQLGAKNRQENAHDLLVIVRSVENEYQNEDGLSTVYAHADFFSGENGAYRFLFTADSFYESSGAGDEWVSLFNDVWFRYFDKAAGMKVTSANEPTVYTRQTATEREWTLRSKYAVYTQTSYPKGIYRTEEEFLNMAPGIKDFRAASQFNDPYDGQDIYLVNEKGKRGEKMEPTAFYAAYNGRFWVKTTGSRCVKMYPDKGEFYYKDFKRAIGESERNTSYYRIKLNAGNGTPVPVSRARID